MKNKLIKVSKCISTFLLPFLMPSLAFAATADTVFGYALGYLGQVFRYVGVFIAAWAFIQLILSLRNEDADSKLRSIPILVIGIILIFTPNIITTFLNAAGMSSISVQSVTL